MKPPAFKPVVKLIGHDNHPFYIISKVKQALKKAGADQEYIKKYIDEATSGNYDHLLVVTMNYVDVE
jgi:hypothetical protein